MSKSFDFHSSSLGTLESAASIIVCKLYLIFYQFHPAQFMLNASNKPVGRNKSNYKQHGTYFVVNIITTKSTSAPYVQNLIRNGNGSRTFRLAEHTEEKKGLSESCAPEQVNSQALIRWYFQPRTQVIRTYKGCKNVFDFDVFQKQDMLPDCRA